MNDNRLIELEIKAAYQDDLLQALNTIVSKQQQQIERLEATCGVLNERIKSLSTDGLRDENFANSGYDIPPHY